MHEWSNPFLFIGLIQRNYSKLS
uniref:Uncharacterized protein n=1 Tax=Arundo donax TaxID=35708 RepID=A0A0A9C0J8_ARUDO